MPGYLEEPQTLVVFDTVGELSLGLTVYLWINMNVVGTTLIPRDRAMDLMTRALSEKGIAMPVPVEIMNK